MGIQVAGSTGGLARGGSRQRFCRVRLSKRQLPPLFSRDMLCDVSGQGDEGEEEAEVVVVEEEKEAAAAVVCT